MVNARARTRKMSRIDGDGEDQAEAVPSSPASARRRMPGTVSRKPSGRDTALPSSTHGPAFARRRRFYLAVGAALLLLSLLLWAQSHFDDVSISKDVHWLLRAASHDVYGVETDRQRMERHFYEAPAHAGDHLRRRVDLLHKHLHFVERDHHSYHPVADA